jgi:hypothetical protein
MSSEQYAPDEPASFDAIVERQPYEPPKESADPFVGKEGLSEAADAVNLGRETRELPRRFINDPDHPGVPAPKDVTVTKETATHALAHARAVEADATQAEIERVTTAAIDDFRSEQPAQPEQPEFQQPQPQAPEVQAEYVAEPDELDKLLGPLDEETRRNIKQGLIQEYSKRQASIEQAREAAVAHAEAARAAFEQGAAEAMLRGEALLLSQAPELAAVPREQRLLALDILEKQNPTRAAQIRALDRQIGAHLQREGQQLQAAQQRQTEAQAQQRAQAAQLFQQWGGGGRCKDRQTFGDRNAGAALRNSAGSGRHTARRRDDRRADRFYVAERRDLQVGHCAEDVDAGGKGAHRCARSSRRKSKPGCASSAPRNGV